MQNTKVHGVVVEHDPDAALPAAASGGLYLKTDDGQLLELVTGHMATQMSIDAMWHQSRAAFEPWLGQAVTVRGYLSRRTLYSAMVADPSDDDDVVDLH